MSAASEPAPAYSRAFESLVQNDDDLTGLLAYALYKKSIREAVADGRVVHKSGDRTPTETEAGAYRRAADGLLSRFGDSIIDQSRADIIDTAVRQDLVRFRSELSGEIRRATDWRFAIGTNLAGWLLSIAITVVIVAAGVPGWIEALIASVKRG